MAFVLINAEIGDKERVFKRIGEVDDVKEAYMCYGVYDIIATIQAETNAKLREKVIRIQKIDNVKSTLTMAVVA